MVKKSIRKSIALVAAGSLALTGLATAPASAAGLLVVGYVTLPPTSGSEYDVLTGNAKEFSLTANFANAAEDAGEYLKFLVTNSNEDIVVEIQTLQPIGQVISPSLTWHKVSLA